VRRVTRTLAAATTLLLAATAIVGAPAAQAADGITIWSDAAHAPVLQKIFADGYKGTPVSVVTKELGAIRSELTTVGRGEAPDVIWGDLAWTGELASADLLVPVQMTKKRNKQFRTNVLVGSNVGGDRYGVPVQISNLALITNTALVPQQPTTFSALSALALKLKKDKKARVPFALAQSEGTSPWSTYPLFSGLGGYLFGRTSNGSLSTTDVGLANKKFLGNAGQIDNWNASGLIKSSLTAERARTVFKKGNSAFFLAGPEDLDYLLSLGFAYRIGAVPPMVNQILAHIGNTPTELIRYSQKDGMLVEAYSPIAHGELMNNPQVAEIAGRYGVSVPQLSIRYVLELGLLPLPKTANPAHMADNADVDFTISDEDIETLKGLEHTDYGDANAMPVFGGER